MAGVSDVRIRQREESDLDGCVQVLAEVYQHDGYPTTWPADPAAWLTPRNMAQGWVAVRDHRAIVGHVIVQTGGSLPDRKAQVARLCVAPSARGVGLGAGLLAQATRWAQERGFDLMLEVTADERSHAIALYERTGWRRVETVRAPWTNADGDVVMMHRYVLPAGSR
jgi:ribosomal protein S18 acetylase RimI-like enzyme